MGHGNDGDRFNKSFTFTDSGSPSDDNTGTFFTLRSASSATGRSVSVFIYGMARVETMLNQSGIHGITSEHVIKAVAQVKQSFSC